MTATYRHRNGHAEAFTDDRYGDAPGHPDFSHGQYAYDAGYAEEDERSLAEVLRDLGMHTQQLVKGEVELAKTELSANIRKASVYAAFAAGAAVLAVTSLIFLGHLIAQGLNAALPEWASYAIVFALFAVGAVALAWAAKRGFDNVELAPHDTIETAREDVQWVLQNK